MLIDELKALQRRHGYLPREELAALGQRTGIPLYALHSVATFYPHFRQAPPPRWELRVCTDLSCHLRGSSEVLAQCERQLAEGNLDATVTPCSCLGQCDRAPALSLNGEHFGGLDAQKLEALFSALRSGSLPRLQRKPRVVSVGELPSPPPYAAVTSLLNGTLSADEVLLTLKESGLRGMGGAGFPCAAKWELVRNATPGPAVVPWWDARRGFVPADKYVICNADESEPGTFKDRDLMRRVPHLVVEGMILAALIVGASEGTIFIRHEYHRERALLERELRKARRLLRSLAPTLTLKLSVFESPGGYICGEETALLEALEGKRAEPRNKPPFPGTHGLYGKPTVINNVETFAWVPAILHRGASWFASQGIHGATGLKYLALSGDVRRPGVYEVPLGIRAGDFIAECGGGVRHPRSRRRAKLKAFMPGGASSGFLTASLIDTPLDFRPLAQLGSMLGSGAVVAIAEGRCMLDLALNVVQFFRNESCGKCVPCREGSQRIVEILTRARRGEATEADFELISELAEAMQLTSICGLGQVAALPITSVLKHFRSEVDAHFERRCPAGVCFG